MTNRSHGNQVSEKISTKNARNLRKNSWINTVGEQIALARQPLFADLARDLTFVAMDLNDHWSVSILDQSNRNLKILKSPAKPAFSSVTSYSVC